MLSPDKIRAALSPVPREVRDYVNACVDAGRVYEAKRALAEALEDSRLADEIVASLIREGSGE